MASSGVEYPSRFMVDSRRNRIIQNILFVLVSIALFGIALETCFIYHLYMTKQCSELLHNKDFPQTDARKAGSERPGADGVMPWNDKVDLELHELQYKDKKLVVKEEGYYYIYSKLCFDADEVSFNHLVVMTTPRHAMWDLLSSFYAPDTMETTPKHSEK